MQSTECHLEYPKLYLRPLFTRGTTYAVRGVSVFCTTTRVRVAGTGNITAPEALGEGDVRGVYIRTVGPAQAQFTGTHCRLGHVRLASPPNSLAGD
ncbi:hypothetical protein J6590_030710 [Homalodisca vitripennis]|nr:hypothetical protein J6590_030710 [Homalodisca vitripennis]